MPNKKFFFVTTIPASLKFFDGQYVLLKEYYEVRLVSSCGDELEKVGEDRELKVHCIPMKRNISLLNDFVGLFRFIKLFRKEKPYIVHGNTPKGSLLSMLASWLTRVPVRIYMCHGLRFQGCLGVKQKLLVFMEKVTCRCATHVVCVSNGVKQLMIEKKITNKEPMVIWNGSVKGIDVKRFDPQNSLNTQEVKHRFGICDDDFVLTFVGRVVKDKGVNELVEAFSMLSEKYRNMKLLLIGRFEENDNPISNRTKEIIEKNDAIIAPGRQDNIPGILAISDLFVFPSYREGFGLSLMEAGAMGVPSISTNIIGCNEIVIEGETGLLIHPRSSQEIVKSVEYLYKDRELLEEMRGKCRMSIVSRYESKQLFDKYMSFYKSFL